MNPKEFFAVLMGFVGGILLVIYLPGNYLTNVKWFNNNFSSGPVLGNQQNKRRVNRNYTFQDFKGILQDDPLLIDYIRREIIHPPSKQPYNLDKPGLKHFSQYGQSQWLESQLTKGMRDGFFIEVGAVNGEYLSNSLYFERELGWRGLLIEPNADMFKQLLAKNRKAYCVNSALSLMPSPSEINLVYSGVNGDTTFLSKDNKGASIKAFPIYSLLLALNVTQVDYFSLDIEGQELKALRTIPWDKLKFKILGIEKVLTEEGVDKLVQFVEDQGYKFIGLRDLDAWFLDPELYAKHPNITM